MDEEEKGMVKWVNHHIKNSPENQIENLRQIGEKTTTLILLSESLTKKKVDKNYSKNPRMRIQRLESVNVALNHLSNSKEMKVRVRGVSAQDLIDGNIRIIHGFIWALILQFEIIPLFRWLGSLDDVAADPTYKECVESGLQWLNDQVKRFEGVEGVTLPKSLEEVDGKVIGALIESLFPGELSSTPEGSISFSRQNPAKALSIVQEFQIPSFCDYESRVSERIVLLSLSAFLVWLQDSGGFVKPAGSQK